MTNSKMEALARQLVASPHWRWLVGMRDMSIGTRALLRVSGEEIEWIVDGMPGSRAHGSVPDLRDAATLGCLLQLVREAWGDPFLVTHGEHDDGDVVWTVRQPLRHGSRVIGRGWSEVEALVAALLAAPEAA